jgi:hypothetical protein
MVRPSSMLHVATGCRGVLRRTVLQLADECGTANEAKLFDFFSVGIEEGLPLALATLQRPESAFDLGDGVVERDQLSFRVCDGAAIRPLDAPP